MEPPGEWGCRDVAELGTYFPSARGRRGEGGVGRAVMEEPAQSLLPLS